MLINRLVGWLVGFYGISTSHGLFHAKFMYIYQIYMNCERIFCSLTFVDKSELNCLHTAILGAILAYISTSM